MEGHENIIIYGILVSMKKVINSLFIFFLALIYSGCVSAVNSGETSGMIIGESTDTGDIRSVELAVNEMEASLQEIDEAFALIRRDIDSPEWLMEFVNYSAGKDLFVVESFHRILKYQNWSPEEKKQFTEKILDRNSGILSLIRNEYYEELQYLIVHSLPLQEYPWFIPSLFDSNSEFSYWYLMYTLKSIDPLWVDNNILPAMLSLIPLDEITPVTYLWLRTPESLAQMNQEIFQAGYPWTILYHLKRVNSELTEMINALFGDEDNPLSQKEGVLM